MSLDRLIKLAKKTGDRLIVHNPVDDTDVVIMDVDEYEMLIEDKQDVRDLSERQLLNQINRDISIWRASDKLEREMEEYGGEDLDFADNNSDWHSTASVLENNDLDEYVTDELVTDDDDEDELEELEMEEMPSFETPQLITETEGIKEVENTSKGLISDDEPVFYEEPV